MCTLMTRRVALLSIAASVATMLLKFGAYWVTGSVGLLSDAAESAVNLTAALVAFAALSIADRPPDENHAYGHDKAEYFSSGVEGALILVAAVSILYAAGHRLVQPAQLENLGVGAAIALMASAINFGVARVMLRVARQHDSIALEADAHHLLSDVWTSLGVIAGLGLARLSGWHLLDPLIALAVGLNIVRTGIGLVRRSTQGLMDTALPAKEVDTIREVINRVAGHETPYHALRTRKSGSRRFVDLHLLLPGETTVQQSHDLAERIEAAIRQELANTSVTIHVEPQEDTSSWDAQAVGGLSHDPR